MRVQWGPVLVALVAGALLGQRFNHLHPMVTTSAGSPPTL